MLRQADYLRVKNAIHDLPGVRFTSATRLLAPDAGFASQVLPAVRRETAAQLDGTPGWSVLAVDGTGNPVTTLLETAPLPGTTVATGLDLAIQTAAEDAVEPVKQPTVLVAVAPSTGDLLAVAQNGPADAAGAISLTGRYPPGSTFKMVTATAAVAGLHLTVDTPEPCPGVTVIGGRPVPNEGEFDLGTVPLRTAFARSCNTTFAQLGAQLPPDALPSAALRLGLGADYRVPGADDGHRRRAAVDRHRAAGRERVRAGAGHRDAAGHGAGRGHRGARGERSCRSSSTAVPPRCSRRRHHPTRPRSTSSGR